MRNFADITTAMSFQALPQLSNSSTEFGALQAAPIKTEGEPVYAAAYAASSYSNYAVPMQMDSQQFASSSLSNSYSAGPYSDPAYAAGYPSLPPLPQPTGGTPMDDSSDSQHVGSDNSASAPADFTSSAAAVKASAKNAKGPRTAVACAPCHRLKVRCDGKIPVSSRAHCRER